MAMAIEQALAQMAFVHGADINGILQSLVGVAHVLKLFQPLRPKVLVRMVEQRHSVIGLLEVPSGPAPWRTPRSSR